MLNKLRRHVDVQRSYDVPIEMCDVHAVAGLLKLWLRELADPVVPYDL